MISFVVGDRKITLGSPLLVLTVIWGFVAAYYRQLRFLSLDARLFPMFLIVGILISGIFVICQNVLIEEQTSVSAENTEQAKGEKTAERALSRRGYLFVAGVAVTIFFFVNTVASIAIIPCTALLLYITGVRNIKVYGLLPIGLAIFIYLFFEKWLSVNLPNIFY